MDAMKVSVKVALQLHPFLTATLDEGKRTPSSPGPLYQRYELNGNLVGPRVRLDTLQREKASCPWRDSNHRFWTSCSWTSHYTA
jgi:hypothetical protein